jgi:hypothetical protein
MLRIMVFVSENLFSGTKQLTKHLIFGMLYCFFLSFNCSAKSAPILIKALYAEQCPNCEKEWSVFFQSLRQNNSEIKIWILTKLNDKQLINKLIKFKYDSLSPDSIIYDEAFFNHIENKGLLDAVLLLPSNNNNNNYNDFLINKRFSAFSSGDRSNLFKILNSLKEVKEVENISLSDFSFSDDITLYRANNTIFVCDKTLRSLTYFSDWNTKPNFTELTSRNLYQILKNTYFLDHFFSISEFEKMTQKDLAQTYIEKIAGFNDSIVYLYCKMAKLTLTKFQGKRYTAINYLPYLVGWNYTSNTPVSLVLLKYKNPYESNDVQMPTIIKNNSLIVPAYVEPDTIVQKFKIHLYTFKNISTSGVLKYSERFSLPSSYSIAAVQKNFYIQITLDRLLALSPAFAYDLKRKKNIPGLKRGEEYHIESGNLDGEINYWKFLDNIILIESVNQNKLVSLSYHPSAIGYFPFGLDLTSAYLYNPLEKSVLILKYGF